MLNRGRLGRASNLKHCGGRMSRESGAIHSDEITERASGAERGLIWSMIHSVEMARAVVDSLLDANRPPQPR